MRGLVIFERAALPQPSPTGDRLDASLSSGRPQRMTQKKEEGGKGKRKEGKRRKLLLSCLGVCGR